MAFSSGDAVVGVHVAGRDAQNVGQGHDKGHGTAIFRRQTARVKIDQLGEGGRRGNSRQAVDQVVLHGESSIVAFDAPERGQEVVLRASGATSFGMVAVAHRE